MATSIDPSRVFTRQQVEDLLTAAINKTLLQIDNAKLFVRHEGRDKVKEVLADNPDLCEELEAKIGEQVKEQGLETILNKIGK